MQTQPREASGDQDSNPLPSHCEAAVLISALCFLASLCKHFSFIVPFLTIVLEILHSKLMFPSGFFFIFKHTSMDYFKSKKKA